MSRRRIAIIAGATVSAGVIAGGARGEGGGSEVEVVTRAGQPLEVRLDARFRVIGVEGDTDDHNASEDQAGFDDD